MITVERLSMAYGESVVVKDFDLLVPQGKTVVLLGSSGCGKTSAMRCIAGLEQPTAGRIRVGNNVVFDGAKGINVPANKRNVGMVFQSYAIWPHRTVFENVAFSLRMKGILQKDIAAKVKSTLELVGLEEMADRGASLLSGGQMQRVALARSLIMEPTALLLDEPLSNLDARLRDRLRVELRETQQRSGLTWLYVTHDQAEAFALADQVAIMEAGQIIQIGSPEQVYDEPLTARIADFLGVANILSCRPAATESGFGMFDIGEGVRPLRGKLKAAGASGDLKACIRSEDIHFADSRTAANSWQANIAVVDFQGAFTRYRTKLQSGLSLDVVRARNAGPTLQVGEPVIVTVAEDDVMILPSGDKN